MGFEPRALGWERVFMGNDDPGSKAFCAVDLFYGFGFQQRNEIFPKFFEAG
jgi:hypothetical protein